MTYCDKSVLKDLCGDLHCSQCYKTVGSDLAEITCGIEKLTRDDDDKYHFVGHSQTKGFNSYREQIIKILEGLKR